MKLMQITVAVLIVLLVADVADARRYYRHHHRDRPRPVSVQVKATPVKPSFPDDRPSIQYPNATGSSVLDAAGRTGDWNIKIVTSCL